METLLNFGMVNEMKSFKFLISTQNELKNRKGLTFFNNFSKNIFSPPKGFCWTIPSSVAELVFAFRNSVICPFCYSLNHSAIFSNHTLLFFAENCLDWRVKITSDSSPTNGVDDEVVWLTNFSNAPKINRKWNIYLQ